MTEVIKILLWLLMMLSSGLAGYHFGMYRNKIKRHKEEE